MVENLTVHNKPVKNQLVAALLAGVGLGPWLAYSRHFNPTVIILVAFVIVGAAYILTNKVLFPPDRPIDKIEKVL